MALKEYQVQREEENNQRRNKHIGAVLCTTRIVDKRNVAVSMLKDDDTSSIYSSISGRVKHLVGMIENRKYDDETRSSSSTASSSIVRRRKKQRRDGPSVRLGVQEEKRESVITCARVRNHRRGSKQPRKATAMIV